MGCGLDHLFNLWSLHHARDFTELQGEGATDVRLAPSSQHQEFLSGPESSWRSLSSLPERKVSRLRESEEVFEDTHLDGRESPAKPFT